MRVTFLVEYFRPFEIGGAERSTERLAQALAQTGVPVTVITPNYGAAAHERADGVEIVRLPFPQRLQPGQLVRRIWAGNPVLHAAYASAIAKRIRSAGSALLHVQNSGLLVAGWRAAARTRVPLVVTVRDLSYLEPQAHPQLAAPPAASSSVKWRLDAWWAARERAAKRRALADASAAIFVSGALKALYERHGVHLPRRTEVVHNIGPEPTSGDAARDARSILFVGKLSTGKGVHVLYEAAARIRERVPNARILLAGLPGTGFSSPPSSVADMFVQLGRVDAATVSTLMRECGAVVAPAVWPEPLSRVLLEAMAAGAPIVASDAGGNAEALEAGRSALIVPAGDAAALADAIVLTLTDRALADRLGTEARARARAHFSQPAVLSKIERIYRDVTAR